MNAETDPGTQAGEHTVDDLAKDAAVGAVESLVTTLCNDPVPSARAAATEALVRQGETGAAALASLLHDDHLWEQPNLREQIENLLERLGSSAVDALVTTLRSQDWRARDAAAKLLGRIGDARAIPALIAALQDPSGAVRETAAVVVGHFRAPLGRVPLSALLSDAHWRVRRAAAEALGRIGDPEATGDLASALNDAEPAVQSAAANALAALNTREARSALRTWEHAQLSKLASDE